MSDHDDMTEINGTTAEGAYNSADQPSADSQGATPVSNDDSSKAAVSSADHSTTSGSDAKLYGDTKEEMRKNSYIATMRRGFKKPVQPKPAPQTHTSTAAGLRDQPSNPHGRIVLAPSAQAPAKTGFGKVLVKNRFLVGKKVGVNPQSAKPAAAQVSPAPAPKLAPATHIAGIEIPHELKQHFAAGNVIPQEHPLREQAAKFVADVWRKNVPEGKRMSLKLLGIGEEPGQTHPNAKPGYATVKDEHPTAKKKLEKDGGQVPIPPTETTSTGPSLQERGHQVQQAMSGGLPEKTGLANVAQEFGNLFGKAEDDAKNVSAAPVAPAAEAPKPYNPKTERPNQRARVQDVKSQLMADPEKTKVSLSTTNSKLAKDGIASFNLVPIETCPGAGSCAKYCYADTGSFLRFWKTTMPPRVSNWLASQKEDFVPKMVDMIQKAKTAKGAKAIKAIRVHDSGDFYSPQYIDKWTEIAKAHPDVKFYAYTKSHHPNLRSRLNELEKLPNFNVVQSMGSKYDHLIDPSKPHAVVFPDEASMKKAGYADAMESDLAAADKNNRKVGLYIHGQYDKSYPGLEEHIKGNPQIQKEVMEALKHGVDTKKSEPLSLRRLLKART